MLIENDREFNFELEDCPFCDNTGIGKDVRTANTCQHNFTIADHFAMTPVIEDIKRDLAELQLAQKVMIRIITKEVLGVSYEPASLAGN